MGRRKKHEESGHAESWLVSYCDMISLLVTVLVTLLVAGLIVWLVRLLGPSLGLPPPFITAIVAVFAVIAVIWLIYALLGTGELGLHRLP